MNARYFILICTFCTLYFAPQAGTAQDADALFTSANQAFEQQEFATAEKHYRSLVDQGLASASLYLNLGTALYRQGRQGEAMLWFRRAELIDSHSPEIRQNTQFLKSHLGFLEFSDSGLSKFLQWIPLRMGYWLTATLLWIAAISLAAAYCLPQLRESRPGFVTLSIVALLFSIATWQLSRYQNTQIAPQNFATITGAEVTALTAPSPSSRAVIELPPGSEVRIVESTGKWVYVDIPSDIRGWIRAEHVQPVWPIPTTASAPSATTAKAKL